MTVTAVETTWGVFKETYRKNDTLLSKVGEFKTATEAEDAASRQVESELEEGVWTYFIAPLTRVFRKHTKEDD